MAAEQKKCSKTRRMQLAAEDAVVAVYRATQRSTRMSAFSFYAIQASIHVLRRENSLHSDDDSSSGCCRCDDWLTNIDVRGLCLCRLPANTNRFHNGGCTIDKGHRPNSQQNLLPDDDDAVAAAVVAVYRRIYSALSDPHRNMYTQTNGVKVQSQCEPDRTEQYSLPMMMMTPMKNITAAAVDSVVVDRRIQFIPDPHWGLLETHKKGTSRYPV
jgi:hypothetical protein